MDVAKHRHAHPTIMPFDRPDQVGRGGLTLGR
jgi:hypothetical protein